MGSRSLILYMWFAHCKSLIVGCEENSCHEGNSRRWGQRAIFIQRILGCMWHSRLRVWQVYFLLFDWLNDVYLFSTCSLCVNIYCALTRLEATVIGRKRLLCIDDALSCGDQMSEFFFFFLVSLQFWWVVMEESDWIACRSCNSRWGHWIWGPLPHGFSERRSWLIPDFHTRIHQGKGSLIDLRVKWKQLD